MTQSLAQSFAYAIGIIYCVVCFQQILVRKTWNKNVLVKLATAVFALSFGAYGAMGFLGWPAREYRDFTHVFLALCGSAIVTAKLLDRKRGWRANSCSR